MMAPVGKCTWLGASGREYAYDIFENPPNFSPNQDGNYIYAKKNESGHWVPIYIGEGCLSERCCDNHHKAKAIAQKGATHVHAHLNSVETARKSEEKDLLGRYTNAYESHGCNDRLGG
jgi:aromatic ring hydroxylase